MGSSLQWGSNIKGIVKGRENLINVRKPYKCAGTTSDKTGSIFLHQREKGESHTLSDRQQGSLVLPFENGGNKERKYDQIEQRDLALSSKSQYGYHSRIPAFSTEYSSRQRIKKKTRLFIVASSSQSFSSRFSTTRFSDNKSICFPPVPPTTSMYSLAFRSLHSGDRCNDTKLEHRSSLCICAFQYDLKRAPKNKTGMCSSSDFDCTSLEYPTMVPRTLKPLCQGTSAAAPGTRNSDKPKKYCPPIDGGELIDTSGLVGFRTTLLCEGISENTSHIITNSRRKGTLTNYESAWRKWASWWLERKIDDFAFQRWQRI